MKRNRCCGNRRRNSALYQKSLLEVLEPRMLLDGVTDVLTLVEQSEPAPVTTVDVQVTPGASWLTPQSIRSFYGFNNLSFGNGSIVADGRGQTIAIIDWGDDPNIAADLDHFDQQYGTSSSSPSLYAQYGAAGGPGGFLTVYAQNGSANDFQLATTPGITLPPDASSNGYQTNTEIALDVEWAHALAPGARIVLVEACDGTVTNLTNAINFAKTLAGVSVVSMSFSREDGGTHYDDAMLSQAGVTFVASTGDRGSYARGAITHPDVYTSGAVSGTGIGGTSDSFSSHTESQLTGIIGDFTFVTQIVDGTTATQAGISIRNGTSPTATDVENVSLLTSGTTGTFQYRTEAGGTTSSFAVASAVVRGQTPPPPLAVSP
jgi:hypothetical protein